MPRQSNCRSAILLIVLLLTLDARAQAVQYLTIYSTNHSTAHCPLQTNQLVSLIGLSTTTPGVLAATFPDNTAIQIVPQVGAIQTFSGLTDISLTSSSASFVTFQITTPNGVDVVSNYVPADAVVIPSSATGTVQVILESSPDLVNWTAASPGIYSPSAGTNRFFRVRAATSP